MESMQAIRGRIASISSTRQITESMRLVSTSKVQKTRVRLEESRPFSAGLELALAQAVPSFRRSSHPYVRGNGAAGAVIIVISSDRGLCGGYNINVAKEAMALADSLQDVRLITVGSKSRDYCRDLPVGHSVVGVSESPQFDDAGDLAAVALEWYDCGQVGEVYLVYTRFESLLSQVPQSLRLLPLTVSQEGGAPPCDTDREVYLNRLVPFYITGRIFEAMLESAASEQSARITSMDAAVKNSDEMIEDLTLLYNQARQSAITQEITEIVSGAEAVGTK